MMTKIYDLAYEFNENSEVLIEQDTGCGEVDRVILHPIHLRLLCTELGMFNGSESAWRQVATLTRRLKLLRARVETLHDMLVSMPVYPPGAGDDSSENLFSEATLEMANEFCAELEGPCESGQEVTPPATEGDQAVLDLAHSYFAAP